MSTKEIALNIFNQLDEKQLEAFVTLFGKMFSDTETKLLQSSEKIDIGEVDEEKAAILERIEKIKKKITPFPTDFDEKAEYLVYLDERYGV